MGMVEGMADVRERQWMSGASVDVRGVSGCQGKGASVGLSVSWCAVLAVLYFTCAGVLYYY
jgi:hypothetical protein